MNTKLLALLVAMLIPVLLPFLLARYGLQVPRRKWVVWYIFWAILASLIAVQIYTIEHVLVVRPSILDFGKDGTEMTIIITNNGSGVIRWQIQKTGLDWIGVNPEHGAVGAEERKVKVTVNRSMIPAETTTASFMVVGRAGENVTVQVRLGG